LGPGSALAAAKRLYPAEIAANMRDKESRRDLMLKTKARQILLKSDRFRRYLVSYRARKRELRIKAQWGKFFIGSIRL
jgi:hypothetical protein